MEGPSLVILHEELEPFLGKKVLKVSGNTKQPKEMLQGRILSEIDTWGKVIFLTFSSPKKSIPDIVTKTHFLLFGSYRINDPKENRFPRLELKFANGMVYFYSCAIQFEGQEYLSKVDRGVDVMSPDWDAEHITNLMIHKKDTHLCDLFLDQQLFAGAGNIVKNEVLFNIRRHPLTKLTDITKRDWVQLAHAVRDYCFNFYTWKKEFKLRKHWQVYKQSVCPVCMTKLKKEKMGKLKRMTFFCPRCQDKRIDSKRLVVHEVLPVKVAGKKEARFDH
jgi:endonuclease-8